MRRLPPPSGVYTYALPVYHYTYHRTYPYNSGIRSTPGKSPGSTLPTNLEMELLSLLPVAGDDDDVCI